MLRTPKKQDAANAAINADRNKRHTSWRSGGHQGEGRLLEYLERRIRPQTFCRLCMSHQCCLDHAQRTDGTKQRKPNEDNMEEIQSKLSTMRKKRQEIEKFSKHLGNFLTHCQVGLKHQPYLASQWHLPPWLISVFENGLTLPLVPLFPTSKSEFISITHGLKSTELKFPEEYKSAASCIRRLRIAFPNRGESKIDKSHQILAVSSLPPLEIAEETNDGKIMGLSPVILDCAGTMMNIRETNERNQTPDQREMTSQQLVEQCLEWSTAFVCHDAKVTECRDERVLIEGMFRVPVSLDNLPISTTSCQKTMPKNRNNMGCHSVSSEGLLCAPPDRAHGCAVCETFDGVSTHSDIDTTTISISGLSCLDKSVIPSPSTNSLPVTITPSSSMRIFSSDRINDSTESLDSSDSRSKVREQTQLERNEMHISRQSLSLPFKLLIFPGDRVAPDTMRVYGTFLRRAGEDSKFSLRWKYDVNIQS